MANISLKNFRKYDTLEPLFLNDINIFVGKNNAGKSTVVKALLLALDNIRSLNWTNVPKEEGLQSIQLPVPYFRYDANGFHNLHIGTYERAICNYSNDNQIVIEFEYRGVSFKIVVSGNADGGHVTMPIESIVISVPTGGSYEFDFKQRHMSFRITQEPVDESISSSEDQDLLRLNSLIQNLESVLKSAVENADAVKVAESQAELKRLRAIRNKRIHDQETQVRSDVRFVTFPLYYLHETVGENSLIQYIKALLEYSGRSEFNIESSGTVLSSQKKAGTTNMLYKVEMDQRRFVMDNRMMIVNDISVLESVLSTVNVDYIQAHAATQKLILSTDDRQDINSKVVHEFFQEHILPGEAVDNWLKKWLSEFEIGDAIEIKPLDGEGYYVKVIGNGETTHLADMGMGSIQLVILLLRLATIANRILNNGQPWLVVVEEPEQNIHPMLQSKLAELFKDFNSKFTSRMIIETHSEYLVRRTQLMVADRAYVDAEDLAMDWPFTVYYFPSEHRRQPYDMEYQTNGLFVRKFDAGFFDEAGRMHMEILKRSKR